MMDCKYCGRKMTDRHVPTMDYAPSHWDRLLECETCGAKCDMVIYDKPDETFQNEEIWTPPAQATQNETH